MLAAAGQSAPHATAPEVCFKQGLAGLAGRLLPLLPASRALRGLLLPLLLWLLPLRVRCIARRALRAAAVGVQRRSTASSAASSARAWLSTAWSAGKRMGQRSRFSEQPCRMRTLQPKAETAGACTCAHADSSGL